LEQLWKIILLGTIQGLTEWLPISSTGHLKIAEHFLKFFTIEDLLLFEFILHIGTLIVVLFFFRKDIKNLLTALAHWDLKSEHGKLIPLLAIGTVSAAIVGLLLEKYAANMIQSLSTIAIALILFGTILFASKTAKEEKDAISISTTIIIGIAEGIAIIPGVSRSGATIAIALLLGIKREKAFKFSFLLSIPAIIGAIGYTFIQEYGKLASAGLSWTEISLGVITAMIVGYFALKLLWKTLAKKKFHFFAFYCWLLGIILIALSLMGF